MGNQFRYSPPARNMSNMVATQNVGREYNTNNLTITILSITLPCLMADQIPKGTETEYTMRIARILMSKVIGKALLIFSMTGCRSLNDRPKSSTAMFLSHLR